MSSDDMAPMVFTEWPSEYRNGTSLNVTGWPKDYDLTTPSALTHTAVDKLFGFDNDETHPIFSKLPQPYNTVFNVSDFYGHNSIYLLATSENGTYTMCSMRVAQSPDCFTEYKASMSGGSLTSQCGNYPLAYSKSEPNAPNGSWEKDWKDVASEWGYGLSLNAGISDGNSAISRLLTQLIPTTNALDPNLPSISEALAVLAGSTLILSSQGSPFIHCKAICRTFLFLSEAAFQVTRHALGAEPILLVYLLLKCVLLSHFPSTVGMLTAKCARLELHGEYPKGSAVSSFQCHTPNARVHVRWPAFLAKDILCCARGRICHKRLLLGLLCYQRQPHDGFH